MSEAIGWPDNECLEGEAGIKRVCSGSRGGGFGEVDGWGERQKEVVVGCWGWGGDVDADSYRSAGVFGQNGGQELDKPFFEAPLD